MQEIYKTSKWKFFRNKILKIDDNKCTRCGSSSDTRNLHIHHKHYIKDKLPWEYPDKHCKTLCKNCHAQFHGKSLPQKDWKHCEIYDLEDIDGSCQNQNCNTGIRYVHVIHHYAWGTLEVGCICADRLTGSTYASQQETSLKSFLKKQETFINSPKWKSTKGGNLRIRTKGIDISIIKDKYLPGYKLVADDRWSKKTFSNQSEAKKYLFKDLNNGKLRAYIDEQQYKNILDFCRQ